MKKEILDCYYKRPVLFDVLISSFFSGIFGVLYYFNNITIPSNSDVIETVTDISNVSLTSVGFILTLLTILLAFQSENVEGKKKSLVVSIFFEKGLYEQTIIHIRNCISSLVAIALVGYLLKMTILESFKWTIHFYNIVAIIILVLSLMRCSFILRKTISFNTDVKDSDKQENEIDF